MTEMTAPAPGVGSGEDEALAEVWWISDGPVDDGGRKILGPFESRDLALKVRHLYEDHADARGLTFWVSRDSRAESERAALIAAAEKRGAEAVVAAVEETYNYSRTQPDDGTDWAFIVRAVARSAARAASAAVGRDAARCNAILRGYYGDEVLCTRPAGHDGEHRSDSVNDRASAAVEGER